MGRSNVEQWVKQTIVAHLYQTNKLPPIKMQGRMHRGQDRRWGCLVAQAIANPEELERFARDLKQFNSQLADSLSRLNGQFSNLGETWRDQEHQKFAQEFVQTTRVLQHFMGSAEQHIPFLLKKASILRQYLNRG